MSWTTYEAIGARGRGGDGVLTILKTLSYAGLKKSCQVCFSSNYNPETRGGLVEGSTILSAEEILSPIVEKYTTVFVFDKKGFDAFVPRLVPGGLLIWNTAAVVDFTAPDEVRAVGLPMSDLAIRLGQPKFTNMVALGAYATASGLFTLDELVEGMSAFLPVWRQDLVPVNRAILAAIMATDLQTLERGEVSEMALSV